MFLSRRNITIEWGDCDPAGIVFYPRYFAMFDAATAGLFAAALGYNKFEMLRRFNIIGIPMVDTGAKFSLPSKFGDTIAIETQITRFHRTSFDISHRVTKQHGATAIEAHETRVWASRHPDDPQRIKGTPIPDEIIEALSNTN